MKTLFLVFFFFFPSMLTSLMLLNLSWSVVSILKFSLRRSSLVENSRNAFMNILDTEFGLPRAILFVFVLT